MTLTREKRAALETCHRDGCDQPSLIVIRIALDEGPDFTAFCREHLRVASEFLAALADDADRLAETDAEVDP